jgi:ribosomal protein S18 acetylase RimI-like enzyme
MISEEQIEYMLAQRYSPEAMTDAVASGRLCFELLLREDEPVAFAAHGPINATTEFKLQQLYVHPDWQGQGLGGLLLDHVEKLARQTGHVAITLTVNRRNTRARALYEQRGFRVRRETQIEIGNGFVMDDYVMEKVLT